MPSARRALLLLLLIGLVNGAFLGLGHLLAASVVPAWKKGPLIDPAAPYAPENALVIFAWVSCVVFDLYLLLLGAWRRWRPARWWVPLLALLIAVGVAELGIRTWLRSAQLTYFRPHPVLHWTVRPDLDHFPNLIGGGSISTNADGMRNVTQAREKPADTFRILVLGDSSNFGHGVDGDEVWSWKLQELLAGRIPGQTVEVLNGACPGWTTYQAGEYMRLVGDAYDPDLVIAGFNNDPGPEYFGDRARVQPWAVRSVNGLLWRLETFLLFREVVLSSLRRFAPTPEIHYSSRQAHKEPELAELEAEKDQGLVPRVPLQEFLDNVLGLHSAQVAKGRRFVWINMPINRIEAGLVDRYVNHEYRRRLAEEASRAGFPIVDVDARWLRTRETELHLLGHVHHPSAKGHARMAEQIAAELVGSATLPEAQGPVPIGGWPPAPTEPTLRMGISTFTTVHAHVAAVLEAMPELAARHGLVVEAQGYLKGSTLGEDVSAGRLDAFFTAEAPAVRLVSSRSDLRIVASPGSLGRVALLAPVDGPASLAELRGRRVGFAAGSTSEMDWREWGKGLGAVDVPLETEALALALAQGQVDAVVTWDPWVEQLLQQAPGRLVVLAEREMRSNLAVSTSWSAYEAGRARRLVALVQEALLIAASNRPRWDAIVAQRSGWPLSVVRAVSDRNDWLAGRASLSTGTMAIQEVDRALLTRALSFAGAEGLELEALLDPGLLDDQPAVIRYSPGLQSAAATGKEQSFTFIPQPGQPMPIGPPPPGSRPPLPPAQASHPAKQ